MKNLYYTATTYTTAYANIFAADANGEAVANIDDSGIILGWAVLWTANLHTYVTVFGSDKYLHKMLYITRNVHASNWNRVIAYTTYSFTTATAASLQVGETEVSAGSAYDIEKSGTDGTIDVG